MAPGSIFYHISLSSTFICIFTFPIYIIKYQKYIYLIILSLSDLTFASGREWIDNPIIAFVARFLFVCVGAWDFWGASYWIVTLILKNWGKYLRYFVASPFHLQGKPTQAQDVARRIFGAVVGEVFAQVKTYQVPITNSSPWHYIICHLPLVFLSPTSPLPFYSPSLFPSPLFRLLLVCSCVRSFISSSWLVLDLLICLPSLKFFTSSKGKEKT